MALISQGRAGKPIANHPIAPFQGRTDQPLDVLGSIRCIEQQFRRWRWSLLRSGVQQELAHRRKRKGGEGTEALSSVDMARLERANAKLRAQFKIRRQVLLHRLDVTLASFLCAYDAPTAPSE